MAITAKMINDLRQLTNSGIMDCKKALTETNGDVEAAIKILREKGLAIQVKRADKESKEGVIKALSAADGKTIAMAEVNCETDFVAKNEKFREFVHDVALQIASSSPLYVSKEDVPQEDIDKEKEVLRQQALNEGKPEKIVDRMVEGRISKFYDEYCLLEQQSVKYPDMKIKDLLTDLIRIIGEKITIRRFVRYERGEGISKAAE